MDPMIRMIYASRITQLGSADVHDILNSSRRNNPPLGLSGMLVFADGFFLQALEAPAHGSMRSARASCATRATPTRRSCITARSTSASLATGRWDMC
jgi:hypothetical protein